MRSLILVVGLLKAHPLHMAPNSLNPVKNSFVFESLKSGQLFFPNKSGLTSYLLMNINDLGAMAASSVI